MGGDTLAQASHATRTGCALRADDLHLLRVAMSSTADLWVEGARPSSRSNRVRAGRLTPSGNSVEGSCRLVAPKSILIIVIVEHSVTPFQGPVEARAAVKMTICLHPL